MPMVLPVSYLTRDFELRFRQPPGPLLLVPPSIPGPFRFDRDVQPPPPPTLPLSFRVLSDWLVWVPPWLRSPLFPVYCPEGWAALPKTIHSLTERIPLIVFVFILSSRESMGSN